MKKIIGAIIAVVIIACAAVFYVQKRVEDSVREYLALLPEPYALTADTISYSVLGNKLVLSGVTFRADIDIASLARRYGLPERSLSVSGRIGEVMVSGFDVFAGKEAFDEPGRALAEQCVLKQYVVESSTGAGQVKGAVEEAEYANVTLRSDATLNQLLATTDILELLSMVEMDSGTIRAITMDMDSGMKAFMERYALREVKNGNIAETVMEGYRVEAYGQLLLSAGAIRATDINYRGLAKPSLETPPLTGIALTDVAFPLLGGDFARSLGFFEIKMEGGAVKNFTLRFTGLDVTRALADETFGPFAKMGYPDYIPTHGAASVSVDTKTMVLLINGMEFGFQDGFDADLAFGDCRLPLRPLARRLAPDTVGAGLTLRKAALTLEDHSFLERLKKASPETVRELQKAFASERLPEAIRKGLAAHFENPGTLTIAVESPQPIQASELENMLETNAVPESWISVTASPR